MRPLVLVGAHAEVLVGLARGALATEEDGVGTGGGAGGKLVEGEAFTAGLEDALARGLGEAEGGDRELGDFDQTDIVGDGADDDDDLAVAASVVGLLCDAREGEGRAVDLGEEEAVEDGLKQRDRKYVKT